MKACVLNGIGQLDYQDAATPTPKKGEVLLKIKASGICGSDIERVFVKGTYHFPTIPGHEFAGEIIAAGETVSPDLVGKKAAVFPLVPCQECDMCEVGEYASCRNYNYFGSRCDGGMAEYAAVPAWNLIIPEADLSYQEMAMAEPAAVSLHALTQAGVNLGDTVAVFGAGAIGLMLSEFAKAWGAAKVILFDIDQRKLDFAKSLGYTYGINTGKQGWQQQVTAITDDRGADVVIEGTGAASALEGCLTISKPKGKVVLMGNPGGDMLIHQKEYWEILRKQLTVTGTWNSDYTQQKNDWKVALAAIAAGKLDVTKFITHKFPLAQCNTAFALVRDKKEFANRVMFIMEDER